MTNQQLKSFLQQLAEKNTDLAHNSNEDNGPLKIAFFPSLGKFTQEMNTRADVPLMVIVNISSRLESQDMDNVYKLHNCTFEILGKPDGQYEFEREEDIINDCELICENLVQEMIYAWDLAMDEPESDVLRFDPNTVRLQETARDQFVGMSVSFEIKSFAFNTI